MEYELGSPVSRLLSKTQDGSTCAVPEYHESYAYIDGLGRTVATLSEADDEDDGFNWVVEGLTDYDQKGAERRKYLAWTTDVHPTDYDLSLASPAKYGQQRYDAFGRAVETQGLDGTVTLYTKYHALSADAWDAEDIGPGPHQGTYASEEKDGHGRVKRTTERVRIDGGQIEERHVEMLYFATGEPERITRRRGGDEYVRRMEYDSLGRMVANFEPTGGVNGWRYLYDEAGDLVATSDPRECGVNFAYDRGGRLLSEDYSPCATYHEPYDTDPEVTYEYDDAPTEAATAFSDPTSTGYVAGQDCRNSNFTQGRLVAVTDRAQREPHLL